MHILVPQFILKKYASGEKFGSFTAASVFLDLSGFSDLTDKLMTMGQHGAEILASIMRKLFDPMTNAVYEHNGFIASTTGDAFTALFISNEPGGAEIYHSAINCAVKLQEIMAEMNLQQTPIGDFSLSAGIGISSGVVNWGIIPSQNNQRAIFYFRGDPIDKCIEAEMVAGDGDIILDSTTTIQLDGIIDTQGVNDHHRLVSNTVPLSALTPTTIPVIDLEIAKKFHPEAIVTQDHIGEFRHVVNMFVSLPTVRTEAQLEIFAQSIFKLQDMYGGILNRLDFGDKGAHLLLFWGAPVTFENDITRALNFILDLQSETSIPIKAGITYRIAHAGFIGNEMREDYTCYGHGVNLAARFMTTAARGNVWVDEPIAVRSGNLFDLEFEGEYPFKGFKEKQKTFSLFERKERPKAIFNTHFAGRTSELKRILDSIKSLSEDVTTPAPIMIIGAPGIGKSRIVHEARILSSEFPKQIMWARCQTDQILKNSFNPFRYWAKGYFEINENHAEARNKRNFNRKLDLLISSTSSSSLASELDRTRSFLGSLVNLRWEDSLFEQLDPQNRYENTLISILTLLKAESLLQPLVLLIEDIQWLDEDSKTLIQLIYRELNATTDQYFPILILGTSREFDTNPFLENNSPHELIHLLELPKNEIKAIAQTIIEEEITEEFAKSLCEYAEGNPFYAEQIILYLQNNNFLIKTDSGWGLPDEKAMRLPEDVRTLLTARLDQIDPSVKKVIQTASVFGREVNLNLLSHILSEEPQIKQKLTQAENASFFTQLSENVYLFQSNLLRDAAYQIQTITQRRDLHALAVEAYETVFWNDLSAYYPDLAHHAQNANLIEKAIKYLREAGISAQQNYQISQALNYFNRAIELHTSQDTCEYFDLLMHRENVHNLLGDRECQLNDLRLAENIAETLDDNELKGRVHRSYSAYYSHIGEYKTSIEQAQRAIFFAERIDSHQLVSSAHLLWSNSARHLGDYEIAKQQSLATMTLAEKSNDLPTMCQALNSLSLIASQIGEFEEASEYLEKSLEILKNFSALTPQAQTLNNLGNIYGEIGDYSSAYETYIDALEITQKIGNRMGEAMVTSNLGWIAGLLGNYQLSKQHLQRGITIAKEIDDIYIRAFSLVNLALFSTSQQDHIRANQFTDEALALLREAGHRPGEASALTYKGHAQFGLGNYLDSKTNYQAAHTLMGELKQQILSYEPLSGIANVDFKTKGPETAYETAAEIFDFLESGGKFDGIDQPFRIYTVCSNILLALNHPKSNIFIRNAYELLHEQANKIKDEKSRESFLNLVPCHREMIEIYNQNSINFLGISASK